jgi:hypothetical protein
MADQFSDNDIKQLGEALGKAMTGATNPIARKKKLEQFAQTEKGIALTKLSNAQIKQVVKDSKIEEKLQKETISNLQKLNNREKIRDTAGATLGFAKAVYRGEGTISSYTDAIAGKFGMIGEAIAGTGRFLDVNIETYRQLSQVGANFGQSLIQLRQAAANSALPLDDFTKLVGENSQAMAALRGSTTQGAEFIAGLSNALRTEAVPQLSTLGFTVDEINETLIRNLEMQRRSGVFDANATKFNIDSAIRFGTQLDRLAKLTGQQRSEIQQEIEAAQSNAKFEAFMQGQTIETTQRLKLFSGTVAGLAPGLTEGFQDLIANSGRPVTDAAIALVQNIPEAQGVIQDLISGTISTETALSRIRDASTKSIDRFRSATVTGQVEFLALQNDIINLGRRLVDVNAVLGEQGAESDKLTKGLTQFQEASKRASSAVQSVETAFLSMTGNLLGDATSAINVGLTGFSKFLLTLPGEVAAPLYGLGKMFQYGLGLLRDTGPTYLAVRAGVAAGMHGAGGIRSMMGGAKGFAKAGAGFMGKGIGVGAGLMGAGYFGNMAGKKGATAGEKTAGVLGSAASGALAGAMFGPWGALIGGGIGAAYGGYKALSGKRAFGGGMDAGKSYLVHKNEMITPDTSSTVTAKKDVKELLNTETMEKHLALISIHLAEGNKVRSTSLNALNTSNMINNKTRIATENSARKDRNQVGLV